MAQATDDETLSFPPPQNYPWDLSDDEIKVIIKETAEDFIRRNDVNLVLPNAWVTPRRSTPTANIRLRGRAGLTPVSLIPLATRELCCRRLHPWHSPRGLSKALLGSRLLNLSRIGPASSDADKSEIAPGQGRHYHSKPRAMHQRLPSVTNKRMFGLSVVESISIP